MLKVSLVLSLLFVSLNLISSDLRTKVEESADEFSYFRRTPGIGLDKISRLQENWKQAFIVFVVDELQNREKSKRL